MLTVKTKNRIGYASGCWYISQAQACALVPNGCPPRPGYEREVKREEGTVYASHRRGAPSFPTTFRAYVENRAGRYVLRDENHIIDKREV